MATCPKCGGYLGTNHRCRGGRRRLRRIGYAVIGALVGFFVGVMMVEQPTQTLLPFVTAALGAILTSAVLRYVHL